MDFGELFERLEVEAEKILRNKMQPFQPGGYKCPWLNWRKGQSDSKLEQIQGILIMQDWWNDESSISLGEAVKYLGEPKDFKYEDDRTNYNLYDREVWRKAIWEDKNWLVTNAVWGLRKGNKTSGQLPTEVHEVAFTIWSKLVIALATSDDFKVMFAGTWAASGAEQKIWNGLELKQFLKSWKISGQAFEDIQGKAYFCYHPSQWNRKKFSNYADGLP